MMATMSRRSRSATGSSIVGMRAISAAGILRRRNGIMMIKMWIIRRSARVSSTIGMMTRSAAMITAATSGTITEVDKGMWLSWGLVEYK
jgi:hypothetical protein